MSKYATELLVYNDFKNIKNLTGGLTEWIGVCGDSLIVKK